MASGRVLRLAGAAALVAAALPAAATTAAASWPGTNGSIFVIAQEGEDRRIDRYNANGTFGGGAGGDVTEFSGLTTSADGSKLAYSKNGDIVLVDLQTFQETTVVATSGGDRDPAFSFDGRYLVYSSDVADDNAEIYMKDLTQPATDPFRLTTNTVDDFAPVFGNDGTGHGDLIAFVSFDGEDTDIFTMTPGGTGRTNLTNNDTFDFGPNWHPGFDMLAYSSRDAQGVDQVMTMSWDGTGKDQVTSETTGHSYEPAWSPDGTMIAFTRQGTAPGSVGRIFLRPGTPGGTESPFTPADGTDYDRAEWQAFPSQCEPNCGPPEELQPVLFMNLRKHVVVSGGVEGSGDTAGGICGVGTPIQIQRYSKGRFRTIANVATNENGTFSRKVADRTGRYRLKSTEFTDEANGTTCLAATGPVKVHRHPR